MKYAVIHLQGKQYRVQEGDKLVVDRVAEADLKDQTLVTDQVLLVRTDEKTQVGTPVVAGAQVSLKLVREQRGEKIDIRQYRAKSRYRRHIGHRQEQTVFEVAQITA